MKALKRTTVTAVLMGAVFLAGCSSNPTMTDRVKDSIKADKEISKHQERKDAIKEAELRDLRKLGWFFTPPINTSESVFATGMGVHERLNTAMQMARLNGKANLVKQSYSSISLEEVQTDNSGGASGYRSVVDNFVSEFSIKNATTVEQRVFFRDGVYKIYLLVKATRSDLSQREDGIDRQVNESDHQRLLDRVEKSRLQ